MVKMTGTVVFLSMLSVTLILTNSGLIASSCQPARRRRGRDRMVVGFITTYEISTYHH